MNFRKLSEAKLKMILFVSNVFIVREYVSWAFVSIDRNLYCSQYSVIIYLFKSNLNGLNLHDWKKLSRISSFTEQNPAILSIQKKSAILLNIFK